MYFNAINLPLAISAHLLVKKGINVLFVVKEKKAGLADSSDWGLLESLLQIELGSIPLTAIVNNFAYLPPPLALL